MTNDEQNAPATPPREAPSGGLGDGLIALVGSLRFALVIVVLIVAACLTGTLLPQGAQVSAYVAKYPAHAALMERLTAMGLTRVFNCWWFALLLGLLAASLFVCTWRRAITATRVAKHLRGRVIGSVVTHVSMLLILCGGVISTLWGVHGGMDLRVGHTYGSFSAGGGEAAFPFKIRLVDFKIELYEESGPDLAHKSVLGLIKVACPTKGVACELPAVLGVPRTLRADDGWPNDSVVTAVRYVSDFVIDSKTREVLSRSKRDDNPAVLVSVVGGGTTNETWLFAKYPGFNKHVGPEDETAANPLELAFTYERDPSRESRGGGVKDFKSHVQILENGTVVLEKTIEVNSPLAWKGYRFYQSGYNPEDPSWTSFQVVRDPGVSVVFAGFALMIAGMTAVFYINPWLASRAKKTEGKT